jgi:predicted nucleic acid-binding protein
VSQWIVDASLTLGWYPKDEDDRTYNLDVLAGLKTNEALVPFLWMYDVANGLVMAHRRKRLAETDIATILESLEGSFDQRRFARCRQSHAIASPCAQAPVNGV